VSVRAIQAVIERSRAKGTELLVLILIANRSLDDGTPAWIPQKTLCQESRLCERAVRDVLKRLADDEELEIIQNTANVIPIRAKFAPKCFYRIRCWKGVESSPPAESAGESDRQNLPVEPPPKLLHRQNLPAESAGENMVNRQILPDSTGRFCRPDLKEGSVQGSVQREEPPAFAGASSPPDFDEGETRRRMAASMRRPHQRDARRMRH
jgi:hypothetical protein